MSATEFIRQLAACLTSLPAEERESAIAYYTEYFEEAGEEADAAAAALGSPQAVAKRIIAEAGGESTERRTASSGTYSSYGTSYSSYGSAIPAGGSYGSSYAGDYGSGYAYADFSTYPGYFPEDHKKSGGKVRWGIVVAVACAVVTGLVVLGVGLLNMCTRHIISQFHVTEEYAEPSKSTTMEFMDITSYDLTMHSIALTVYAGNPEDCCSVELIDMPDDAVTVVNKDGELRITETVQGTNMPWFTPELPNQPRIVLTIPAVQCEEFALSLGAADGEMHGLVADRLLLNAGEGFLHFTDCEAGSCQLICGSGNLQGEQLRIGDTAYLDIGAGSAQLENVSVGGEAEIDIGSGWMDAMNLRLLGSTTANIGSGDLHLNNTDLRADLHMTTGSGSTVLSVIGDPTLYQVESTTGSGGTFVTGHPGNRPDAPYHIESRSGSGSVEIVFYDEDPMGMAFEGDVDVVEKVDDVAVIAE